MDYQQYTVEDFILDPNFRKWVLKPDKETNLFWEKWAAQHPGKVSLLKEAQQLLLHIPHEKHTLPAPTVDQLWNNIDQQISETESATDQAGIVPLHAEAVLRRHESEPTKNWDYIKFGKAAASVMLLLAFGLMYFLQDEESAAPVVQKELIRKENSWGQRSTIYLSDGTEVNLNAGSSIEYDKNFTDSLRRVVLYGEAFFEVAPDKYKPFQVITSDLITQAVGTSFNVNAYDSSHIEVALITGKVSVKDSKHHRPDSSSLILEPGEGAAYAPNTGVSRYAFDADEVLSWKEGVLYFKGASEASVFHALEKWYGVEIKTVNSSPKNWNYTSSFKGKSLEHVLLSIAYAMDFEFVIDKKTVTITYQ